MDKKELNDLIDRIGLTGPGGVDKIKKILKELANGSSSDSDSGGGEGGDIQIVELTYDHIPATGTLSASDLAKLDGDNCLLVMKGKYFRKTFSSNGGIDYKEIGLATVLGGVRSIYFTISKPDGEYTIAYEYPIQANNPKNQATTALENIKVGNTTYSVPLAPMIVRGTTSDSEGIIPAEGSPTWSEAYAHMLAGGLVYFMSMDELEPDVPLWISLATFVEGSIIFFGFDRENGTYWARASDSEGGGES